jgi:beta-mannosidase
MIDLSGTWRAAPADDDLRREIPSLDREPTTWEPIEVPGHWRSTPAFADADGPLLYRTGFTSPPPDERLGEHATRWWLTFDGLFYQGDVWLDGEYVGDTEGYFFTQELEVTEHLQQQSEHALVVEVACDPQTDRTAKRNLTGVFQHWDLFDPAFNPGGIWQPVKLQPSGPVRVRHFRVVCREASERRAVVALRAVLMSEGQHTVTLITGVGEHTQRDERSLADGENRVEWTVEIPSPDLWWPHALGDQPLYEVDLVVELDDGVVTDRRERTIGLREVELRDWFLSVNGERLFVKGAHHGPTRRALGEATSDEVAADVVTAREIGLDMLRVHAHVARRELYTAADEQGVLLWQDMPLQWGYHRSIRRQARRQARELVDRLAHHASVVVWCGHNEPLALDLDPETLDDPARTAAVGARAAVGMMLPTWNKTVLDHSIKRVLAKTDPSRPVVAHSGVFPHLPQLDGTDSHLYLGWYVGEERTFPDLLRWWPRLARFVSEFGAQAVPDSADFMDPDRWPDLDWDHLIHHHALQKRLFDRYVPPAEYETFDLWRQATQEYQATVIRHHIEALRRLKYRPTGGFLQFCLADGMPAVTWSVLDHQRRPKLGLDALRDACAPVIVVADRPPAVVAPGDRLDLDVHVVSDLRQALGTCRASARLAWTGGEQRWEWAGEVAADSCARIGQVRAIVPDAPGPLTLDLEVVGTDRPVTNRYTTTIPAR